MESTANLRIPPHNTDAEKSVLGSMMVNKNAAEIVLANLSEDYFYKPAHQKIFSAAKAVHDSGDPIDQISVVSRLRSDGNLELAGGAYYVSELTEKIPSTENVRYYAREVSNSHLIRLSILKASEIVSAGYDGAISPGKMIEKVNALSSALLNNRSSDYIEIGNVSEDAMSAVFDRYNNPDSIPGISTGIGQLDRMIGGLREPDLIVIAARPSVGKTAMGMGIVKHAAHNGFKAGVISLEMSAKQLYLRNLFSEANVPGDLLNSGKMEEFQFNRLVRAREVINGLPIFIDDNPDSTASQIIAKAHSLINSKGIDLLIIDYLQLMDEPGHDTRNLELGKITRSLKQLAKKAKIPIVLLSQLTKDAHGRRPVLKDLRDSGAIEQDIDICIFIHRPETCGVDLMPDGTSSLGVTEIIVAKDRNGKVGEFKMKFIPEYVRFEEISYINYGAANEPFGP